MCDRPFFSIVGRLKERDIVWKVYNFSGMLHYVTFERPLINAKYGNIS